MAERFLHLLDDDPRERQMPDDPKNPELVKWLKEADRVIEQERKRMLVFVENLRAASRL